MNAKVSSKYSSRKYVYTVLKCLIESISQACREGRVIILIDWFMIENIGIITLEYVLNFSFIKHKNNIIFRYKID